MNKELVLVLCLFGLLLSASISTTFADTLLMSPEVSYTANRSVSNTNALGDSYDVSVTLIFATVYNCSTDGVLPGSSTCHLNVTPSYGNLTADYHIHRRLVGDKTGTPSTNLSSAVLQGLLGDSPPIEIPIDSVGTITITIHGQLLGDVGVNTGSVNPTSLNWSTWTPRDTAVLANVDTASLTLDTTYNVSFTVAVSIVGFDVASKSSTLTQVTGNPSPEFVIPEFPSFIILPLSLAVIPLVVIVYKRKHFV